MRSSSLPGSDASHVIATLFGFAPDGGYRVSRPPCGLLVSVALFLASRRTAVSRHPALWSPDFPPPITRRRLSSQLQTYFSTPMLYHPLLPRLSRASITGAFGNHLFEHRGGLRFVQAARASSIAARDGEQRRK
jgi:hypothetical protein